MRFDLRRATEADVTAIRELIDASVRGLQASDYTAQQIDAALKTVFTIDGQLIADGTYFVAVSEGGELAGCGGWSNARRYTAETIKWSGSSLGCWILQ
jgi:uncharacterized membrane protein YheB (UPF0754 family)